MSNRAISENRQGNYLKKKENVVDYLIDYRLDLEKGCIVDLLKIGNECNGMNCVRVY